MSTNELIKRFATANETPNQKSPFDKRKGRKEERVFFLIVLIDFWFELTG